MYIVDIYQFITHYLSRDYHEVVQKILVFSLGKKFWNFWFQLDLVSWSMNANFNSSAALLAFSLSFNFMIYSLLGFGRLFFLNSSTSSLFFQVYPNLIPRYLMYSVNTERFLLARHHLSWDDLPGNWEHEECTWIFMFSNNKGTISPSYTLRNDWWRENFNSSSKMVTFVLEHLLRR